MLQYIDNRPVAKPRQNHLQLESSHNESIDEAARETVMEPESKSSPQSDKTSCSFTAQKELFEAKGDVEVARFFSRLAEQIEQASAGFSSAFNNWSTRKE